MKFDISNKHLFNSYIIKRFQTGVVFSKMPSKNWTGDYDAKGGYLVVKSKGKILYYQTSNKNQFENHLQSNIKLDKEISSLQLFGDLYKENEERYFKLNIQVSFKYKLL